MERRTGREGTAILSQHVSSSSSPLADDLEQLFCPWASLSSPIQWEFQISPHTAAGKIK